MKISLLIKITGLKKIKKTFKFGDLLKLAQDLATEVPKTMTAEDILNKFKG